MTEDKTEEKKKRKTPKKMLFIIFVMAIIFGVAYFYKTYEEMLPPLPKIQLPEPPEPAFRGFYKGFKANDKTLWFIFYQHPQYGIQPLLNERTVHSNIVKMAVYSPDRDYLTVEIHSWVAAEDEEGNVHVWGEETEIKELMAGLSDFGSVELELKVSDILRRIEIVYEGQIIWRGYHQTKRAYLPAPAYTLGTLALDRTIYIAGGVFVCFLAIGFSKKLINRVKVVPKISGWVALLSLQALLGITIAVFWWYIYNVALQGVFFTYFPIFLCAFIFGLFILKPKPDMWFFLKMHDTAEIPSADIWQFDIVWGDGPLLDAIGWKDFFMGKKQRIKVNPEGGEPLWYFTSPDHEVDCRLYYIKDVKFDRWGVRANLTGIHQKQLEKFKAEMVSTASVAKALGEVTMELYKVKAESRKQSIIEGAKLAEEYIVKLMVAMGLIEEPTEEEEVEPEI